jgi:acetyl-CoA carboxylase carboxyl transferase subunit alpha
MNLNFLDFEQPIAELEAKIEELRLLNNGLDSDAGIDIKDEIQRLCERSRDLTKSVFSALTSWQISRLARHPQRPYTQDYVARIFTDFEELHGDRTFGDDPAFVCGIARLEGKPIALIGHQKGRNTNENLRCNFGMPRPEGYRKTLRIMRLAEKFKLPLFTFIDTPGAYPGIDAEERGQSEAIARNLMVMVDLKVPIISTVIGEGGSGGALAIGIADHLLMLEYGTYSVISPEGCASILWKSADMAEKAAEAMGMTAPRLFELGLIDEIVNEPLGGAHRNIEAISETLKGVLITALEKLEHSTLEELLATRYHRLMGIGKFNQK